MTFTLGLISKGLLPKTDRPEDYRKGLERACHVVCEEQWADFFHQEKAISFRKLIPLGKRLKSSTTLDLRSFLAGWQARAQS